MNYVISVWQKIRQGTAKQMTIHQRQELGSNLNIQHFPLLSAQYYDTEVAIHYPE